MSFEERKRKEENELFEDYMLEHFGCFPKITDELPDEQPTEEYIFDNVTNKYKKYEVSDKQ